MLIRIKDEADQEAIERVRIKGGDRSWADTVRRLVREADAARGAIPGEYVQRDGNGKELRRMSIVKTKRKGAQS